MTGTEFYIGESVTISMPIRVDEITVYWIDVILYRTGKNEIEWDMAKRSINGKVEKIRIEVERLIRLMDTMRPEDKKPKGAFDQVLDFNKPTK